MPRQILLHLANTKFNENPFGDSGIISCVKTEIGTVEEKLVDAPQYCKERQKK
jgi:hypothetical protein